MNILDSVAFLWASAQLMKIWKDNEKRESDWYLPQKQNVRFMYMYICNHLLLNQFNSDLQYVVAAFLGEGKGERFLEPL